MSYRVDNLSEHYRTMADGELLELAAQKEQLTPEARTALETELSSRGIGEEELNPVNVEEPHTAPTEDANYLRKEIFSDEPQDIPSSDLVAVFSAESEAEAKELQATLGYAGIESQLQIVVLVPQDKAEEAIKIVSDKVEGESEPR